MPYPVNYFWATFQSYLSDGTTFGFNLGDGINSQLTTLDRSTEDYVTLEGKICKLGVTTLDENASDIMSPKHMITSRTNSQDCHCDVLYSPMFETGENVNAVFVKFQQLATWGNYKGHCMVGPKYVSVDGWGFFEHVHARW